MPNDSLPPPNLSPFLPGKGEDMLARILASITDGFVAFDAEWRIVFLNEAARKLLAPHLGDDPETLLGKTFWDTFPALCGTILEREYRRAAADQVPVEFEVLYAPWNRWYSVRGFPITSGGLSAYFRDVTDEKRTATALRQSEERYRLLFDSMDEGFCVVEMIWDEAEQPVDYRFLEINPSFASQTGLQDCVGQRMYELAPDHEPFWREMYGEVARTGKAVRFDHHATALNRWYTGYAFRLGSETAEGRVAILFSDITGRHLVETDAARIAVELRSRVAELETLLAVLPVGIGIALDRECRDIRINPALAGMLRLSPTANASKTAPEDERPTGFRVLDDDAREIPDQELPMQVAAREGRRIGDQEFNITHSDGVTTRMLEYAAPLYDDAGVPRGSVGAFVDITDRRKLEEQQRFLLRLDDTLRPLTDPDQIVAAAAQMLGEHLRVDRCAYANVESDEDTMNITGDYCRDVRSIVGRFTFTQFGADVLRLMRANRPYVVEDIDTYQPPTEALDAYRATSIQAVICVPLHKSGRFVASMAVHQNTPRRWTKGEVSLTQQVANRCWESIERAKVTGELRESDERFRLLADNMAQLAWMADADGRIFWYNQRWFDYTGTQADQMRAEDWVQAQHVDHAERVAEKWQRCLAEVKAWEDTFPLRGQDGSYRWFLSRAAPVCSDDGKALRWFGTHTDVTEQREAANALAAAKDEAERASKAKDDFMAQLSHELRTPLNPVLMTATALRDDETVPAELRAQFDMIERNVALEARLIDDLLDLTRISRGKLPLRMELCDVHSLIQLAVSIIHDEAREKQIEVTLDLQADHFVLSADPARLQQVFWNLVRNAVKFTVAGGKVSVTSRDETSVAGSHEMPRLLIEVSDNGIGFSREDAARIFMPFEQAMSGLKPRSEGLGLGLAIARAIVELHHGTLTADSEGTGLGATFKVSLPALATEVTTISTAGNYPAPPETMIPKALRILLVEDHGATLEVLARHLRRAEHTVIPAATIAAARAAAAAETFDVVISDLGLPDGTGVELMAYLRDTYGMRGIALSGYGMEEDLRRSDEAGFAVHLVKPIKMHDLQRALAQCLRAQPEG